VKPSTIQTLTEIREAYARNVATCEARAAEHEAHGEHEQALAMTKRATKGRAYVETLDDAIKSLTAKAKIASFSKPTFDEVFEYTQQTFPSWPRDDVRAWYDHFEACGWKMGKGKAMTNWRAGTRTGFTFWKRDNPNKASVTITKAKDDSWGAFLAATGHPKTEMRLAPEVMLQAFEKWRKAR